MNKFKSAYIIVLIFGLTLNFSFSQKKTENIGSEVVNVVKPYTPTISDAFKVKETPSFDDEETSKKENIQYNIFSFPVASTFTPAKGKAAGVEKSAPEKTFTNYATLGAGNYGTINGELFLTHQLNSSDYLGFMLRHLSSQGGIKEALLTNSYYNTSADFTYGSRSKDMFWSTDLGFQNQVYNWYGLLPDYYPQTVIDNINPKQKYNNVYLGGRLGLSESVFKEASLKFNRFWDAFGSGENHFVAKPEFNFEVSDYKFKTNLVLDYINGNFKKDYFNITEIKYGFTNIGVQPSVSYNNGDLSANLGMGAFYSMAANGGESKFYIYPQLSASYKVVGDLMIAYAGVDGTLKQNSYKEMVDNNFFVSPTLAIVPTSQTYDAFVGLKGKLANAVGYNIRGSVKQENNKALFVNNYNFIPTSTIENPYQYGNSFGVVYDNVKTISFFGELKADISKSVNLGINGTFSTYAMKNEDKPWNLPNIEINTFGNFDITKKWYAGFNIYFVGQRKDKLTLPDDTLVFPPTYTSNIVTLDSYFDLNLNLNYKHNERLTFYLKGNNLANQKYQKWVNYPVQGIQGVVGANYKFDF